MIQVEELLVSDKEFVEHTTDYQSFSVEISMSDSLRDL
jgi:hypothetical protein